VKFNSEDSTALLPRGKPQVGDVFPAKSTGPKWYRRGTRFFIVVSITKDQSGNDSSHHMLGLDESGNVVSTTTYGAHVMRDRPRLGHCHDIANLNLNIEWDKA
jgi:hypothetical protein